MLETLLLIALGLGLTFAALIVVGFAALVVAMLREAFKRRKVSAERWRCHARGCDRSFVHARQLAGHLMDDHGAMR